MRLFGSETQKPGPQDVMASCITAGEVDNLHLHRWGSKGHATCKCSVRPVGVSFARRNIPCKDDEGAVNDV